MLTLAGFGVLLAPILIQIDSPLAFTLALLVGEMWIIVYAALILSFVTGGRLVSTVDRVLVGMFFVGLFVLQFAVMLFLDARGQPAARAARRRDRRARSTKVQQVVLIVASLARRGRDRRALALGLAAAPASAAAEPGREPVRRPVRRLRSRRCSWSRR